MRLIGPNCPGVLSPGKANVGIIPAQFFDPGSIGVVSKSGTLTYQIGNELKQAGAGNSTIVGIGGDPIVGSDFIDVLTLFEEDAETELIVMVGEIGGDAEERAADFIAEQVSKPVVAYIAGFTAPPGKQMGHAGAIISGSSGTAQAKKEALEATRRARRPQPDRGGAARGRDRRARDAMRCARGLTPRRRRLRAFSSVTSMAVRCARRWPRLISFARGARAPTSCPSRRCGRRRSARSPTTGSGRSPTGPGIGHPGLREWIAERHGLDAPGDGHQRLARGRRDAVPAPGRARATG